MGSIGAPELLIILAVVVLLFGGAKLPQLARSLGQAQKEFRSGQEEDDDRRAVERRTGDTGSGSSGPASPPPA